MEREPKVLMRKLKLGKLSKSDNGRLRRLCPCTQRTEGVSKVISDIIGPVAERVTLNQNDTTCVRNPVVI